MTTVETKTPAAKSERVWEITGRKVAIIVGVFFAVIFAVNAVLIGYALNTFGGVETRNAYQAGLAFKSDIAAARAQEARHWRVELTLPSAAKDAVEVVARDAAGRPLAGLQTTLVFVHPTNSGQDTSVALTEGAAGTYRGTAVLPRGRWDAVIEMSKDGERMFRSKNRVELR